VYKSAKISTVYVNLSTEPQFIQNGALIVPSSKWAIADKENDSGCGIETTASKLRHLTHTQEHIRKAICGLAKTTTNWQLYVVAAPEAESIISS
jgi:hypothetical protein